VIARSDHSSLEIVNNLMRTITVHFRHITSNFRLLLSTELLIGATYSLGGRVAVTIWVKAFP
jgi:hypothetical protein